MGSGGNLKEITAVLTVFGGYLNLLQTGHTLWHGEGDHIVAPGIYRCLLTAYLHATLFFSKEITCNSSGRSICIQGVDHWCQLAVVKRSRRIYKTAGNADILQTDGFLAVDATLNAGTNLSCIVVLGGEQRHDTGYHRSGHRGTIRIIIGNRFLSKSHIIHMEGDAGLFIGHLRFQTKGDSFPLVLEERVVVKFLGGLVPIVVHHSQPGGEILSTHQLSRQEALPIAILVLIKDGHALLEAGRAHPGLKGKINRTVFIHAVQSNKIGLLEGHFHIEGFPIFHGI